MASPGEAAPSAGDAPAAAPAAPPPAASLKAMPKLNAACDLPHDLHAPLLISRQRLGLCASGVAPDANTQGPFSEVTCTLFRSFICTAFLVQIGGKRTATVRDARQVPGQEPRR